MLSLILVAEFGTGAAQLERRFQLLAFVLRHLFPSSPKKILAKGKLYAPSSSADEGRLVWEPDTWEDKDLHITIEYEAVSQFK